MWGGVPVAQEAVQEFVRVGMRRTTYTSLDLMKELPLPTTVMWGPPMLSILSTPRILEICHYHVGSLTASQKKDCGELWGDFVQAHAGEHTQRYLAKEATDGKWTRRLEGAQPGRGRAAGARHRGSAREGARGGGRLHPFRGGYLRGPVFAGVQARSAHYRRSRSS